MTTTGLPVAADTLTRAADLIERLVGTTTRRGGWYPDNRAGAIWPGHDGDGIDVEHEGNRAFILAFQPEMVAALVPALRAASLIAHLSKSIPCADCTDQPDPDCKHADLCATVGPLLEFARRLLCEEEGTDG
jgi:hypothetical protein